MVRKMTCALNWNPLLVSHFSAVIGAKAGFSLQTTSDNPVPVPEVETGPVLMIERAGMTAVHHGSEGVGGMIEMGRGSHEVDDFHGGGILHLGIGRGEIGAQENRGSGRGQGVQGQRIEVNREIRGQSPIPLHVDVADAPGLIKGQKAVTLEEGMARAVLGTMGNCRASGQGIGTMQVLMSAHPRGSRN